MARKPQQAPKAPSKSRFYVIDKDAQFLGPTRIQPKHRKEGIELTDAEAAYFIAAGTISAKDPNEDSAARVAVAEMNAGTAPAKK